MDVRGAGPFTSLLQQRTVVLGGGSGPSLIFNAFRDALEGITACVCTTDTGSSSGRCRGLFDMPAPGDIRAALSTLSRLSGNPSAAQIMECRIDSPKEPMLHGMALGNLWIASLCKALGGIDRAVLKAQQVLGTRGRVIPVTSEGAHIQAVLRDGSRVSMEEEVRAVGKPPIERMGWDGATPRPSKGVLDAIEGAGLLIIGPGCLYTSLWPCLSVEGVSEAVRRCRGLRVFCCNTTTTPGQTEGLSVSDHVRVILDTLGGEGVDVVLVNDQEVPPSVRRAYGAMGVEPLLSTEDDLRAIQSWGITPLLAPLLEEPREVPRSLHKADTIRHDPAKLRRALDGLLAAHRCPETP